MNNESHPGLRHVANVLRVATHPCLKKLIAFGLVTGLLSRRWLLIDKAPVIVI